MKTQFKKVWSIPLLLAVGTLFGFLTALLGNGYWYCLSWLSMAIPLIVVCWKMLQPVIGWKERCNQH